MGEPASKSSMWKWYVCGMLLLATMLNYMDRQTLAQMSTEIRTQLEMDKVQYGYLESGFGIAFAAGAICTGLIVDRVSIRWFYPMVVIGWSAAGFATAYVTDFWSLLICRIALGFLEAGQWPCALTTTQRILTRQDRTLGNGILQSGAALGAIFTPFIVLAMVSEADPQSWRGPFRAIGALGLLWLIPWFLLVRGTDLKRPEIDSAARPELSPTDPHADRGVGSFIRRFAVLIVMVISINICWHFFRAWLPMFLREGHDYSLTFVQYFSVAYYLATDLGSLAIGFITRRLVMNGWSVFAARLVPFLCCALLTSLSVVAAHLSAGYLLLGLLLVIGFGALGLFPNYYAFSQELTARHQGKVTGTLGCLNWIAMAIMQPLVGLNVERTRSFSDGIMIVGLVPLLGFLAAWLFWNWPRSPSVAAASSAKDPQP